MGKQTNKQNKEHPPCPMSKQLERDDALNICHACNGMELVNINSDNLRKKTGTALQEKTNKQKFQIQNTVLSQTTVGKNNPSCYQIWCLF